MKNIPNKLFVFLIPALFTFPLFKENISSLLFILLAVNTLLYLFISGRWNFKPHLLYLTIPFWIVLAFSFIRFASLESLKPVNNALFFLLFPIIFSQIPKMYFTKDKLRLYFDIFKYSCFVIAIGYIIAFLYTYGFSGFFIYTYSTPKFRDFVYYEIGFFKIHPTYYTSMLVFCVAVCFNRILSEKKYIELVYVAVFFLISFLLLAKINIVFMVALLVIMVLRTRFSSGQKAGSVAGLLALTLVLAFTVPGIKKRFAEMYNSYSNPPKGLSYDSTNVRLAIYRCNLALVQENYLYGVGFENLEAKLYECFESNYESDFFKKNTYLTHNYFFYILISAGIVGFLVFLFYWYRLVLTALRINLFFLYVVVINVFLICLTEDFFYRHFGIFYFQLIFMSFLNFAEGLKPNPQSATQTSP